MKSYTLTVKSKQLPDVNLSWLHIGKEREKSKIFEISNFMTTTRALVIKKKKYLKVSTSSYGNNIKCILYLLGKLRPWNYAENFPSPLFHTFLSLVKDFKINAPVVVEEMIRRLLVIHTTMETGFGKMDLICSNEVRQWFELELQIYETSWNYMYFLSFSILFLFPIALPASFVFSVCANISFFLCTLFHPNPTASKAENSDSGR